MIDIYQPSDVPRYANGPMRYGRQMPFGSKRRKPPVTSAPPGGQVFLDGVSSEQASDGYAVWENEVDPNGVIRWIHDTGPDADLAVLFFSMMRDRRGTLSEAASPPAEVFFGSQQMEWITWRANATIFHGFYFLDGLTQSGSVMCTFNPYEGDTAGALWWCMMHMFTFRGAVQSAPLILNQASGSRTATQANPYSPTALTTVAGSWVLDSISVDDSTGPLTAPISTTHIKRTETEVETENLEYYWSTAHALCCATEEHSAIGTYAHPWWWSGGSMAFTYFAVEIRPAA